VRQTWSALGLRNVKKSLQAFTISINFLYIPMCASILNVLDCTKYGDIYRLDLDPEIRCFTLYDSSWVFMVASAIPLFMLYITSAPALILFLNMEQTPQRMDARMDWFSKAITQAGMVCLLIVTTAAQSFISAFVFILALMMIFTVMVLLRESFVSQNDWTETDSEGCTRQAIAGWMYLPFRHECRYWELVSLLRKALVAMTLLYLNKNPLVQIVVTLVILVVYIGLFLRLQPYVDAASVVKARLSQLFDASCDAEGSWSWDHRIDNILDSADYPLKVQQADFDILRNGGITFKGVLATSTQELLNGSLRYTFEPSISVLEHQHLHGQEFTPQQLALLAVYYDMMSSNSDEAISMLTRNGELREMGNFLRSFMTSFSKDMYCEAVCEVFLQLIRQKRKQTLWRNGYDMMCGLNYIEEDQDIVEAMILLVIANLEARGLISFKSDELKKLVTPVGDETKTDAVVDLAYDRGANVQHAACLSLATYDRYEICLSSLLIVLSITGIFVSLDILPDLFGPLALCVLLAVFPVTIYFSHLATEDSNLLRAAGILPTATVEHACSTGLWYGVCFGKSGKESQHVGQALQSHNVQDSSRVRRPPSIQGLPSFGGRRPRIQPGVRTREVSDQNGDNSPPQAIEEEENGAMSATVAPAVGNLPAYQDVASSGDLPLYHDVAASGRLELPRNERIFEKEDSESESHENNGEVLTDPFRNNPFPRRSSDSNRRRTTDDLPFEADLAPIEMQRPDSFCFESEQADDEPESDPVAVTIKELFSRYDLDHSGTINSIEELTQLSLNVLYKIGSNEQSLVNRITNICETHDIETNPISLDQYTQWLKAQLGDINADKGMV